MKKQKIYFICPSNKFVAGGVKQIYKMVETLNENNFHAVLLLKKKKKNHGLIPKYQQRFLHIFLKK